MIPAPHASFSIRVLTWASVLATLLLAVACAESAPSPAPTATPSPTEAPSIPTSTPVTGATPTDAEREELDEIQAHAAEVRGLEPLAEVECRFLTREAAELYLRQGIEEEERALVSETQPVYELLDFIPPGEDLMELMLSLISSQVMGFYDMDVQMMFIVGQDEELDTMGAIILAHEFVHALQDQHFDIHALMEESNENWDWDADLALTALLEGDATLAETDYVIRFVGLADILDIDFAEIEGLMTELEDFPEALQEELSFPYEAGVDFVTALFDEGGWAAVNDAFDAPPTTTEQILHPEKYLTGEAAREVDLPDLAPELGEDWQLEASNTLGEFILSNYLDTQLTRFDARDAAAGWGGDRWELYSDGAAGRLLLLVIEWDAPEELDEFFAAYLEWLDARSEGDWESLDDNAALWDGPHVAIYAGRQEGAASLILSTDASALDRARRALDLP
jgi:hypothetical protein